MSKDLLDFVFFEDIVMRVIKCFLMIISSLTACLSVSYGMKQVEVDTIESKSMNPVAPSCGGNGGGDGNSLDF